MADIDYKKSASESIDQYNSRIATARAANTPAPTNTSSSDASTNFMSQLQSKLLGQSDIISSENTNLENKITEAISTVQKGATANAASITSQYDREKGYAQEAGQSQYTSALEAQRGFAQNTAGLKQLASDTDKQLKDLEMRKQELIMQGNATAAGKVADLQFQAIQFHQQAQQQVFSNLLGMANFGLQQQAHQDAMSQFNRQMAFEETQASGAIALQYGLTPRPGENLQSLYARAVTDMGKNSPAALDIQSKITDIALHKAQTSAALASARANQPLSALDLESLASAYNSAGSAILGQVNNASDQAHIITLANQQQNASYAQAALADFHNGISKADAIQRVLSNPSIINKAGAVQSVNATYQNVTNPKRSGSSQPSAAGLSGTFPGRLPTGGLAGVQPYQPPTETQIAQSRATFGTPLGGF